MQDDALCRRFHRLFQLLAHPAIITSVFTNYASRQLGLGSRPRFLCAICKSLGKASTFASGEKIQNPLAPDVLLAVCFLAAEDTQTAAIFAGVLAHVMSVLVCVT